MALDLSALRRIIADENRLLTGTDIPAEYQSDVLGRVHGSAEALAFPLSTEEVSALLRYAHEHRVPITPRGAGTNLVGSTVPLEGGIILDLSRMDRVLELDEDTMTVTVEPGMLLQDLQAYVEARGLFYPPDPGEKASSIGGNISTNAGGMRAVKYGVTRDYVRGLEVVLADGTVMQVGGKQVKDASGLSLKHLLIGSEGTLAVITKCLLRLVPKPEASLSVLVPYADLKTGIQSVLTILRANANPTAVEFMERKVVALGERFCGVSYPRPDAGSYILLTFDGRSEEVTANAARVRSLALQNGALDFIELSDARQCADIWRVRGERDEETWQRELHENMDRAYAEAYRLGGVASGEHGIGLSKRPYFLRQTAKENLQAMNAIKTALDPQHILNNGKSYLTGGNNNAGTF
ncbi:MAG TPA: 2-hydroxy-acid oxidase [Oscillibacter sp.]|nr:2-hydroxy-acid oxidase [Oscillibacter sp.]